MKNKLTMRLLQGEYGACRLDNNTQIPAWCQQGEFYSITKTSEELSLVCLKEYIPEDIKYEGDWRILKVEGPLDFSLIGILSAISGALAKAAISIFAISTYDTDYILVKKENIERAIATLEKEGYEIII